MSSQILLPRCAQSLAPMWMATAFLFPTLKVNSPFRATVTVDPEHFAPFLTPSITLQYLPGGRLVWKFEFQSWSELLIATNPAHPRPNATCCEVGENQSVN